MEDSKFTNCQPSDSTEKKTNNRLPKIRVSNNKRDQNLNVTPKLRPKLPLSSQLRGCESGYQTNCSFPTNHKSTISFSTESKREGRKSIYSELSRNDGLKEKAKLVGKKSEEPGDEMVIKYSTTEYLVLPPIRLGKRN